MDTPCCIDQSLLLWTLETGSFHGNMKLASERQVSAPQKTAPVMSMEQMQLIQLWHSNQTFVHLCIFSNHDIFVCEICHNF